MPIFFLVGGYASGASLASHRASGFDGIGWVLRRTDRLLRPTTALFVVLPVVTSVTVAAGVDKKLLGTAAWLASVPLWFLLAYLALVVLTPLLHALHRRAGLAVPAAMVVLVAVADLLRLGLDVPIVGQSSYLFAWLAVYQLGFCWRDGLLRLGPGQALAVAAGGLVALIGLTVVGPYELAMVGYNTNPPTLALMALATTQVGVVLALQPAANRWLRRTRPWTAVVASNAVILTVFLWHMTAAAIAAVVLFPTGVMAQPPLDSAAWLLWRVPWMAFCTVVLAVLVALFARIELRRSVLRPVERGLWRDGATVLGLAAVLAGLLAVAVSGPDYHGPPGLPWGAWLRTCAVPLCCAWSEPDLFGRPHVDDCRGLGGKVPVKCLDLPGEVVKDQPARTVGGLVLGPGKERSDAAAPRAAAHQPGRQARGRKRAVHLRTSEVEGAGHGGGPAQHDRVGHDLGRCR